MPLYYTGRYSRMFQRNILNVIYQNLNSLSYILSLLLTDLKNSETVLTDVTTDMTPCLLHILALINAIPTVDLNTVFDNSKFE